jgi:hypothetical protein
VTRNPFVGPVVHLTPSLVEEWQWCRRAYRNRHLLQLPSLVDERRQTSVGLDVHRLLEAVHREGVCGDVGRAENLVSAAGLSVSALMPYLRRHFEQCCGTGAGWAEHELPLARFRRRAEPMWLVTGKLDAVWERRHVLEGRDYKTGYCGLERVGDDLAARVQAYLLAPVAAARELGVRIRYEYLSPDAAGVESPEPFEPDDEDLAAIELELDLLAAAIASEIEFAGCGHAPTCGRCAYRDVCPVAALPVPAPAAALV